MYDNFFGFKERPFQLVPNPKYLFLSRSHEEAIAHLNYAISHGDGFVEITGEVGTGKTTLCRAFLEDLDENSEVAYIFNPQLNSLELLRAINDEFGIPADADNTKDLIDTLNVFLMEKKSQKKNAILLIDEAQNLNKEVLEQLRLLSNLETNTSKLLQIILVGQPELQKMLDSYDLRQLRQRITLSWYLTPLSRKETREYIRHRVNIASKKTEDKFTGSAYHWIYKYSGGIPRLINIVCDRALLTAFGFNRRKVTGSIARSSIKELNARGGDTHRIFTKGRVLTGFIVLFCLALITMVLFKLPPVFKPGTVVEEKSAGDQVSMTKTSWTFEDFLGNLTSRSSRFIAVKTALSLWETTPRLNQYLNNIDENGAFFQFAAARNNFQILAVNNDWDLIKKLNLPAVLEFLPPGAISPRFLTIIKMTENEIILKGGEKNEIISVKPAEMQSYWSGNAYILWKDFFNYRGKIPIDAPKESVFTLKMLLRDIGFKEIKLDYVYDDFTRETVKKIQEKHGIVVDGIVGAKTKIVIYNEKKELKIPHIRSLNDSPGDKKKE
ncbi:MAG: AAA family ATPase [Candidatus Aminicenantes bacterium]|nr:AAA family ATPase [Candidatus Aminicenantes bacterium]NIM78953.1 AAA family ATPase [Candidatus Aminicenantes bacterium]NIN18213.1 AAA family ATPase [Candidatus Aminicenantes bacterium]NIN42112.1 AAA family ATPase [Candidatus Aminicenantes bacterium]NIN84865.1 AAA family ATPase [Candidatus Aminicenantes bacterium]